MFTKKAVVMSVLEELGEQHPFAELSRFRADFYECLAARADASTAGATARCTVR